MARDVAGIRTTSQEQVGSHVLSTAKVDPLNDDVGQLLKKLQSRLSWGKEQESTRTALVSLLKSKRYIFFFGHYQRYGLARVGQSCIYDVPERKRGHLSVFAGKRIRIACVGSGSFKFPLAAGVYAAASAD